jgi:hypothetical protein
MSRRGGAVVIGGASGLRHRRLGHRRALDINGGAHLRRYPDLYSHVMKAFA